MATLERTWASSLNNAFTPVSAIDVSRRILWSLKAMLKGELGGLTGTGLWTHYASSDSVTAGIDATDRWTGAYDGTKIVRAAAGSAHSWIVLKSPVMADGNNWYLIIDFVGTSDAAARFVWAKTAPTGGSITARPTSVDEFGTFKTATAGVTTLNDATFATNYRVNMALSTTGDFWFGVGKVGAGFLNFGMITTVLGDVPAGDSYPLFGMAEYNASTPGAFMASSVACSAISGGTAAGNMMQKRDGSGAVPGVVALPAAASAGTAVAVTQIFATAQVPVGYDVVNLKYFDWPCHVISFDSTSNNNYGYRGRLVDFALGVASPQGTVEPLGGTYTSTMLGTMWLPLGASAVAPLL